MSAVYRNIFEYIFDTTASSQQLADESALNTLLAQQYVVFVTRTNGVVTGEPLHLQPWLLDSRLVFGGEAQCVLTVRRRSIARRIP